MNDEVEEDIVSKDCFFERSAFSLSESNVDDFHYLVVQDIVHVVLLEESNQRRKEVGGLCYDLFAV